MLDFNYKGSHVYLPYSNECNLILGMSNLGKTRLFRILSIMSGDLPSDEPTLVPSGVRDLCRFRLIEFQHSTSPVNVVDDLENAKSLIIIDEIDEFVDSLVSNKNYKSLDRLEKLANETKLPLILTCKKLPKNFYVKDRNIFKFVDNGELITLVPILEDGLVGGV